MRDRNGTRTHQQRAAIYMYETSSSLFPNLCFFQHQQCTDSSLPDMSQTSVGTWRNKTFFKLKCMGKKIKCVEAHREQHPRNPKHDDVWFLTLPSLWSVRGFPPTSYSPNSLFFLLLCAPNSSVSAFLFFYSSSGPCHSGYSLHRLEDDRENTKLKITPCL